MIFLYIDTSSNYLYSGIVKDDCLVSQIKQSFKKDMSTFALSEIAKMIKKSGFKPNEIDKIIVCNGPGSFTGIRIGVTIAKTYAWSLNKEITTITSLEAMAISSNYDGFKVPIIDARRGYVYGAIFDRDNNQVMEGKHIKLDTLKVACKNFGNNYKFIANDAILVDSENYEPNILKIIKYSESKESINPHGVNPIYLKKTEAEENKNIEC